MSTEALAPLSWAKRVLLDARRTLPLQDENQFPLLAAYAPKLKDAGTDCVNQENIAPMTLTADDLDETNTRLFVKSLSPELHDYGFLYRVFRIFGKIRMLALNTKRHNAIVEFETKAAALSAKRDCRCISALSGRTYTIKMFWGKHINREPPVKNPPPTVPQQVERVRQVNLLQIREKQAQLPSSWVRQMLGLFVAEEQNLLDETCDPEVPPGLSSVTSIDSAFSIFDINQDNLGVYPLKTSHAWFQSTPATIARVTRPTQPSQTHALNLRRTWSPDAAVQSGLAGLIYATRQPHVPIQPFSDMEKWDLSSPPSPTTAAAADPFSMDSHSYPSSYSWEVTTEPITPTFLPNRADSPPLSSASSSVASLVDLMDFSVDFSNTPVHSPTPKKLLSRIGKEDAISLVF